MEFIHVSAISAVALAIACGAPAAMAQSMSPELFFSHPYVSFSGGLNSTGVSIGDVYSDYNDVFVDPTSKNVGIGGAFSAAFGVEPMPGLRTEIEASYHRNTGARFDVSSEGTGTLLVDASTFLLMANVWKDFGLSDGFGVHVGGGIGYGSTTLNLTGGAPSTLTHSGLALQAGMGLDYAIASLGALTLDYRVSGVTGTFGSNTIDSTYGGEEFTSQLAKSIDQTVTVGLRIPIGP